MELEALANPIGLKVAVIYQADPATREVHYHMWRVSNGTEMQCTYMNGPDVYMTGNNNLSALTDSTLVIKDDTVFNRVVAALQFTVPVTRSIKI